MCPWGTRYELQAVPGACIEHLALLCDAGSQYRSTIAALKPAGFTAGVAAARLHGQETNNCPHICSSHKALGIVIAG